VVYGTAGATPEYRLPLLILLQDYRFVFPGALVRFLANVFLAGLLAFAGIRLAVILAPGNRSSHLLYG
jgi:hypothetical protein